jgi:hypothetical protein
MRARLDVGAESHSAPVQAMNRKHSDGLLRTEKRMSLC